MFIAKSMEESLRIDEIEVRSLISDSCGKNINSQLYEMELNSSLEGNGNFTPKLDAFCPMEFSGDGYLHGKLQLTDDSILTVDPDAFSNYQNCQDVSNPSNSTTEDDPDELYRSDYKPLPDLLEEIPNARERVDIQPSSSND